jgi:hypothetical protein
MSVLERFGISKAGGRENPDWARIIDEKQFLVHVISVRRHGLLSRRSATGDRADRSIERRTEEAQLVQFGIHDAGKRQLPSSVNPTLCGGNDI